MCSCPDCSGTEDGFAALCRTGAPRLTVLDLFDNHVGDAGVAHLGASFPALQQLDLGANKITDAGVRPAALLP